ncbi:MAG: hypothetical protein WC875_05480 [Candidatus Absconditabacterales bacterium]
MKKLSIGAISLGISVLLLAGCGVLTSSGMKCKYTDEDGKQSVMYIKDNMLYSEAAQSGMNIKGLSRDNKFYIWSDTEAQGMMVDLTTNQDIKINETPITSTKDMITEIQKHSTCTAENVADTLFQVPTDKTF